MSRKRLFVFTLMLQLCGCNAQLQTPESRFITASTVGGAGGVIIGVMVGMPAYGAVLGGIGGAAFETWLHS
jgi:hypothetical protein